MASFYLSEDDDYDEDAGGNDVGQASEAPEVRAHNEDSTREGRMLALSLQQRQMEEDNTGEANPQAQSSAELAERGEDGSDEDGGARRKKRPRKLLKLLFSYTSAMEERFTGNKRKEGLKSKFESTFRRNDKRRRLLSDIVKKGFNREAAAGADMWRTTSFAIPKSARGTIAEERRRILAAKLTKVEDIRLLVDTKEVLSKLQKEIIGRDLSDNTLDSLELMEWEKKIRIPASGNLGEKFDSIVHSTHAALIAEVTQASAIQTRKLSQASSLRKVGREQREYWGKLKETGQDISERMDEMPAEPYSLRAHPRNARMENSNWLKDAERRAGAEDDGTMMGGQRLHPELILNWEDGNLFLESLDQAKAKDAKEAAATKATTGAAHFDHAEAMRQMRAEGEAHDGEGDKTQDLRSLLLPIENAFAAAQLQTVRFNYDGVNPFELHRPKLRNLGEPVRRYLVASLGTAAGSRGAAGFYRREFVRNPSGAVKLKHLSARANELQLFEYVEQHPILTMKVGMGSRVLNLFNTQAETLTEDDKIYEEGRSIIIAQLRDAIKESHNPNAAVQADFGKALRNPFINELPNSSSTQTLFCNLFRAPFHKHKINRDPTAKRMRFLLIRTRTAKVFLRKITSVYTISHVLPNELVMVPKSRQTVDFGRRVVEAFIDRAWGGGKTLESSLGLQTLPFDLVMRMFRGIISIAQIKQVIEHPKGSTIPRGFFKSSRMGWERNPMYHPPSEDIIRQRLTPEHFCVYEAMLRGRWLLQQIGLRTIFSLSVPLTNALIALHANPLHSKSAAVILEAMCYAPWTAAKNYVEDNVRGLFVKTRAGERYFIRISPRQSERALLRGDIPVPGALPLLRNLDTELYETAASKISDTQRRSLRGSAIEALVEDEINRALFEDELARLRTSGRERGFDVEADRMDMEDVRIIYSVEKEVKHRKGKGGDDGDNDGPAGTTRARSSAFRMAEMMEKDRVEVDMGKIQVTLNSIIQQLGSDRRSIGLVEKFTNNKMSKFNPREPITRVINDVEEMKAILERQLMLVTERERMQKSEINRIDLEDERIEQERWKYAQMADSEPKIRISAQRVGGTQLRLKFKTQKRKGGKRRKKGIVDYDGNISDEQDDLYEVPYTPRRQRRRTTTGEVEFHDVLNDIWRELNKLDGAAQYFYHKVDPNRQPDYYEVIKDPITLGMIQEKIKEFKYRSVVEFKNDVELLYNNCVEYNTNRYFFLISLAENIREICNKKCEEYKDQLENYESMIHKAFAKEIAGEPEGENLDEDA